MQPEKILHSDQSMYRYSAYRRLAKVAGYPAAAPCQHHTVPKRVGKTTLEQRRPPSRAVIMRGDRAAISDADGGGGKGIPRALMRNTTITRLPRSIATAFPSATEADAYTRGTDGSNPSPSSGESRSTPSQSPASR